MNKIEALRTAAKAIREGHFYNWRFTHSCNCGVVAQGILGIDAPGLSEKLKPLRAYIEALDSGLSSDWTSAAAIACPVTGKPLNEIFAALDATGFTRTDIRALEYLSDPIICEKAGIKMGVNSVNKTITKRCGLFWLREKKVVGKDTALHFTIAKNVIRYMEAWADMLEEAQPKPSDEELEPQLKEAADRLLART